MNNIKKILSTVVVGMVAFSANVFAEDSLRIVSWGRYVGTYVSRYVGRYVGRWIASKKEGR